MSRERQGLLRLYGARVEVIESMGGMNEAVDAARKLAERDDVFLPDQFSNPANPEAHRRATAPEILEAMDGEVDIFVAGVGTAGRSPAWGGAQGAQPRSEGDRGRAGQLLGALGQPRRPAQESRASAPASSRRCSTARSSTR